MLVLSKTIHLMDKLEILTQLRQRLGERKLELSLSTGEWIREALNYPVLSVCNCTTICEIDR